MVSSAFIKKTYMYVAVRGGRGQSTQRREQKLQQQAMRRAQESDRKIPSGLIRMGKKPTREER